MGMFRLVGLNRTGHQLLHYLVAGTVDCGWVADELFYLVAGVDGADRGDALCGDHFALALTLEDVLN